MTRNGDLIAMVCNECTDVPDEYGRNVNQERTDGNISLLKLGGGHHGSESECPQSGPETQSVLKVVNRIGHL